jgi:hypothetical protein
MTPDARDEVDVKGGFQFISKAGERYSDDDGVLGSVVNVAFAAIGHGSE